MKRTTDRAVISNFLIAVVFALAFVLIGNAAVAAYTTFRSGTQGYNFIQSTGGQSFGVRSYAPNVESTTGFPLALQTSGSISYSFPNAAGVYAYTQNAPALYGYSLNKPGVLGYSWGGAGVYGESANGPAAFFNNRPESGWPTVVLRNTNANSTHYPYISWHDNYSQRDPGSGQGHRGMYLGYGVINSYVELYHDTPVFLIRGASGGYTAFNERVEIRSDLSVSGNLNVMGSLTGAGAKAQGGLYGYCTVTGRVGLNVSVDEGTSASAIEPAYITNGYGGNKTCACRSGYTIKKTGAEDDNGKWTAGGDAFYSCIKN